MSDAPPLPLRPNLESYRNAAKRLQREKNCSRTQAQFIIAHGYGFASWPKFKKHIEELARPGSVVPAFEAAADAIAAGDIATLSTLLRDHPDLVRERSTRDHRSTLLHYVSANGVEDFRQKTPQNIAAIAKRLLDAGADVNAESDAYGGRSTALHLTATSWHPQEAGVQIALMQLLLDRGARMNDTIVNDCLANGRGAAAGFLAARGAKLDVEGAAGVGRLDLVERLFETATDEQKRRALNWACEFGRTGVVRFLADRGITSDTALHWAAHEAHLDIVTLLLERGAPKDARDRRFDSTPLEWAMHGREHSTDKDRYDAVIAALTA